MGRPVSRDSSWSHARWSGKADPAASGTSSGTQTGILSIGKLCYMRRASFLMHSTPRPQARCCCAPPDPLKSVQPCSPSNRTFIGPAALPIGVAITMMLTRSNHVWHRLRGSSLGALCLRRNMILRRDMPPSAAGCRNMHACMWADVSMHACWSWFKAGNSHQGLLIPGECLRISCGHGVIHLTLGHVVPTCPPPDLASSTAITQCQCSA